MTKPEWQPRLCETSTAQWRPMTIHSGRRSSFVILISSFPILSPPENRANHVAP